MIGVIFKRNWQIGNDGISMYSLDVDVEVDFQISSADFILIGLHQEIDQNFRFG